jgi:hypothetical protein
VQDLLNLPDKDLANWKLLEYILFYPIEDRKFRHKTVTPYETIMSICNSSRPAYKLMQSFTDATGIDLRMEAYTTYGYKARTIRPRIPVELKNMTETELRTPYSKKQDIVFFSTGERITAYQERKERETYLMSIMKKELSPEHPLYEVIQHLHSHQCLIWTAKRVSVVAPQIHEFIAQMPNEKERLRVERIWHFVEQYSSIEYDYATNTRRIYSCNSNLITINRDVRKLVFSNCVSLDLKSAHLGIVAKLWGMPLMTEFLTSKQSIWTELFSYCRLERTEENKAGLKHCLYAITYGKARQGQGTTVNQFCIDELGEEAAILFQKHPLIKELLKFRDIALVNIRSSSGAMDAFGNFIYLNSIPKDNYNSQVRSLLSSTVQSYEVRLMLTAYHVIKANPNLLLTAWVHDGIYVSIKNNKKYANVYIEQIQSAVQALIDEYGFITELELP